LARPRRPHDGDELAAPDLQADPAQRVHHDVADDVVLDHVLDGDEAFHRHRTPQKNLGPRPRVGLLGARIGAPPGPVTSTTTSSPSLRGPPAISVCSSSEMPGLKRTETSLLPCAW